MNKGVIIGIVFGVIVIGIIAVNSLNFESNNLTDEKIIDESIPIEEVISEPQTTGRSLSVELTEKVGLHSP